jgi:hypothetical protein
MICNWKNNADQRGIQWELTYELIDELWEKQGARCALSGFMMTTQAGSIYKTSLDRIDSSLGYVEGNVQLVCSAINYMKQSYTTEEFVMLCGAVYKQSMGKKDE